MISAVARISEIRLPEIIPSDCRTQDWARMDRSLASSKNYRGASKDMTTKFVFEAIPEEIARFIPDDGGAGGTASVVPFLDEITSWMSTRIQGHDSQPIFKWTLTRVKEALAHNRPREPTSAREWARRQLPTTELRQSSLHLLEVVAAYASPPGVGLPPPQAGMLAQLLAVARLQFITSNLLAYARVGVGRIAIESTNASTGVRVELLDFSIDTASWVTDRTSHLDRNGDATKASPDLLWLTRQRSTAPSPWGAIDVAFRHENGFGVRELIDILVLLAKIRTDLTPISIERLVEHLMSESGIDQSGAISALQYLTFMPDPARIEPFKQRERMGRLPLQPLIQFGTADLWIPEGLPDMALSVYVKAFHDLVTPWPEPAPALRTPVDDLLKAAEAQRNFAFEEDVAARLRDLGFAAERGVKSLPGVAIPGDIDVLAGIHLGDDFLLVVVEAKDPIETTSPGQIGSQVSNADEWLRKHQQRVNVLREPSAARAAAKRLGVPERGNVLMVDRVVTRTPSICAYVDRFASKISYVDDFVAELRSDIEEHRLPL